MSAQSSYFTEIKNNSHYISETSRKSFRLVNDKCFKAQQGKQLSYYVRLYYHYKHVTDTLGGRAYFYTLTYNDKALPHFNGVPCFDHRNLDWFMRDSGFDKILKRKYGYKLQYFVSCELGEGKGSRGFANNPHYHVIFFLIPDKKAKKSLSHIKFCRLVQNYWQGQFRNPKNFRFGIAKPGDDYGLINSASALSYVSKYVLKDINYYGLYNRLKQSAIGSIFEYLGSRPSVLKIYQRYLEKNPDKYGINPRNNPDVMAFVNRLYESVYKKQIRNRHMPKVRISQGVGLSALDNLNPDNLTINIPHGKAIKTVNLPMYLYRKLYYKVVKDAVGNNKYILNDYGIVSKVDQLDRTLKNKFIKVRDILSVSVENYCPPEDILMKYVIYDLIYRDRLCPDLSLSIDFKSDYRDFLVPDYHLANYSPDGESWLPFLNSYRYESHPYFAPHIKEFQIIDRILENSYICDCERSQDEYNNIMRVKKHFAIDKFYSYVNSL